MLCQMICWSLRDRMLLSVMRPIRTVTASFLPRWQGISVQLVPEPFEKGIQGDPSGYFRDELPRIRVYDLRHRFASAALMRWIDSGKDLYSRLPYLQSYMGHNRLASTAYYIHLLPENLVRSAGIDWDMLEAIIPEVELWED